MAHPVDEYVGKRLRERRNQVGMSQDALAKNSGITFQQVQKYERATNRISVSRLFEFASLLKVPIDFFFEGLANKDGYQLAESTSEFQHEVKQPNNADINELVEAYRKIQNPEMRKSVRTLVTGVANGNTIL